MIDTAVRMISERGVDALSLAALAREMRINRTTIYYHFESRDALLHAVSGLGDRAARQGMDHGAPQPERIGGISRFVLDNAELIKLWIDDFVTGTGYPRELFALGRTGRRDPPRVCPLPRTHRCGGLLRDAAAGSIIGPHVFANKVAPDMSHDEITERFLREHLRVLRRDGLFA